MNLYLYSLVIFNTNAFKIGFKKHQSSILDYDVDWIDNSINSIIEKPDLRTKFLENRRENIKSKQIITALSGASSDVEYSEGIAHHIVNTNMKKYSEIRTMENNFKSMLKMDGVKYDYKRDMHWRTWREVTYPNKSKKIVCYRCENIVNSSCELCHSSGNWAIEENLECPYEIFSLKYDNEICAVDYRQINKIKFDCPLTVKLSVLRDCNNPLETKYLVKKDFKSAFKQNTGSKGICKDRAYCEIFTIYSISPNQTTFRIINSSNHVIYSRIMNPGGRNYVCIDDCGRYDHATKKITSNEKPFIVDLLDQRKKKREYLLTKTVRVNSTTTTEVPFKLGVKIYKNPNYEAAKKKKKEKEVQLKFKKRLIPGTTLSGCQKMRTSTPESPDYEMDEYFEEIL